MFQPSACLKSGFVAALLLVFAIAAFATTPPDTCLPQGCATYTPGAYGGTCPGPHPPTNPACIVADYFDTCVGANLVIGGTFTLTLTSAGAVSAFLPTGGTAGVLTQNYVDPVANTSAGVFAGHLATLALSLAFSNCASAVPTFCDGLGSFVIWTGPFAGYTVQQLFTLGNQVLGGNTGALPAGLTTANLSAAVDSVNRALDNGTANTGFLVDPDCGNEYLPNFWDMGDIQVCYPTEIMNPAHRITGIAWLGAAIDNEDTPNMLDLDNGDDGVTFFAAQWMPCEIESVEVEVTAGPNYTAFTDTNGVLYLNAWKDGNLDCDFCDILCDGTAPEWFIQNEVVTPGSHLFAFPDPGILTLGVYEGRLRFRLSQEPMLGCPPQATDDVGEVEDYIIGDLQLAVELLGTLSAIAGDGAISLAWSTASETDNDRFELYRDGAPLTTLAGAGTSASRHDYRYTDSGLDNGRAYTYALVAVDAMGTRRELATASATPRAGAGIVTAFALHQNYPNPFNPATTIAYELKETVPVMLTVFDLTGRVVAELVNTSQAAGSYSVNFDASHLASGVYLYRLNAGSFSATRKLMLMK